MTAVLLTATACANRSTATTRPTIVPPIAHPQETRVLPTPITRSTPLPSPVLLTPPVAGSTATVAVPTVVPPTATRRPPAFSMPGADSAGATASSAPVPPQNYDAAQVVTQYAADVLGVTVTVVSAGEKTGTLTLPPQAQSAVDAAANIAGETVAAVLENGAASVSLGEGTISGSMQADVQDASLGAFVFQLHTPPPANADSALALVKNTFPGIAGLPFEWQQNSPTAPSGGGKLLLPTPPGGSPPSGRRSAFIFTAVTQQSEPDIRHGQVKMVSVSAIVGVIPAAGGTSVFAVVGKGTLAASVTP